jgi:hypothetical protein
LCIQTINNIENRLMKNISFKAIIISLIALVILDTLGEVILVFLLNGNVTGEGIRTLYTQTSFLMLRAVVAAFALIAAGYIVIKIAKSHFYINSAILGGLAFIITSTAYNPSLPSWYSISAILYQIPFTLLGSYMMIKKQSKKQTTITAQS